MISSSIPLQYFLIKGHFTPYLCTWVAEATHQKQPSTLLRVVTGTHSSFVNPAGWSLPFLLVLFFPTVYSICRASPHPSFKRQASALPVEENERERVCLCVVFLF